MRAPPMVPKKCSVVKVEGCDREEAKEVLHPSTINVSEERASSEDEEIGLCRTDDVHIGQAMSECGLEGEVDTLESLGVKTASTTTNFQEILKEIDLGLSKYDSPVMISSPPRIEDGMVFQTGNPGKCLVSKEGVQTTSTVEGSTPLGGQFQTCKRLDRELVVIVQASVSTSTKCGIQECMEVVEELVPTKK